MVSAVDLIRGVFRVKSRYQMKWALVVLMAMGSTKIRNELSLTTGQRTHSIERFPRIMIQQAIAEESSGFIYGPVR